jgi:hypothetical protein
MNLGTVLRTFGHQTGGVPAPDAPSVSVADDGTGTSLTATVTGEVGYTHNLYVKASASSIWSLAGSRFGNGTIQATGLTAGLYSVLAVSVAGDCYSLPSNLATVRVSSGSPNEVLSLIAQAVTDELNAASWSLAFTAERVYLPIAKLEDRDTLHVTVVPRTYEQSQLSRSANQTDYSIDVGIQQRYSDEANVNIDPLAGLANEIKAAFIRQKLPTYPTARCIQIQQEPPYSVEHMHELRQFTAVLTLVYRVLA